MYNKAACKRYQLKYPWINSYRSAKQRCRAKNHPRSKYYAGKGIKFLLTKEQVKKLWFRDKAYLMLHPSIDREESGGHYEFSNCRFLELRDNSIRACIKATDQFSKMGGFIKRWPSIISAQRTLGLQNIYNVLNGQQKTCGGFIWQYVRGV